MQIYLSNAGQEPIYAQITRQIKQQILSGALRPGDALPSIRLLARELRISVITTKRAYEDLERDGFILTQQGRGSFVAEQNPALLREEHLKKVEDCLQGAVDAARLGGMAGCRPKCSLWAGVALSLGGVALLHYTGWPDAAVYPILAVTG